MEKDHCPFLKYGQCIVAPPQIAFTIVNFERCKKYYKTCKYYLKHTGALTDSKGKQGLRDKNKSLLQFIDKRETKLVTVGYYSSRSNMRERRKSEKLIAKVLEMLLKDSEES